MALTRSERVVKESLQRHEAFEEIAIWFRPVEIRFRSYQSSLPFDYWMLTNNGTFVAIEVKEKNGKTLPFQNIRDSQWEVCEKVSKVGGVSILVVAFKTGRMIKKWTWVALDMDWLLEEKRNGRKSITLRDALFCERSKQLFLEKNYGLTDKGKPTWGVNLFSATRVTRPVRKAMALVNGGKRLVIQGGVTI